MSIIEKGIYYGLVTPYGYERFWENVSDYECCQSHHGYGLDDRIFQYKSGFAPFSVVA